MATQASLDIWSAQWLKTASDYRDIAAFEHKAAKCRNLPRHIRTQAAAAASKALADAAICEEYAKSGTRH